MTWRRRLRNLWCVLVHGRHDMTWPHAMTGATIIAVCRHCGHVGVVCLKDLKPPRVIYRGAVKK